MEEFHFKLNKLITLIYDTALDPALWPMLLEQFSDVVLESLPLRTPQTRLDNHPVMDVLLEHLQRGVDMSEKLTMKDDNTHFEQTIFQQLPLPMLVLSPSGELLQKNQYATTFINKKKLLTIQEGKLFLQNKTLQSQFEQMLDKINQTDQTQPQYSMRLRDNNQNLPVSINLSRISDQYELKGNILLLIASYELEQLPDLITIGEHFRLTPAELRVVEKLISSNTLHEIALQHQVSIHTVRTQLKSIFKKTNCRRQSELIKLIMNLPALPALNARQSLSAQTYYNAPCYHKKIILNDQRQLGYADLGASNGTPVIMLHPSTGSRLQQHPDENILFDSKVRVIAPDRPGFGLSDHNPHMSLANYGEDLRELVSQLNIKKFILVGYCGGAPYALMAAAQLGNLVTHTVLISPVTPYRMIDLFHGVKSSNKLLARIALNCPSALHPLLNLMARNLLNEPDKYFDQIYPHLCESDAAALSEPEVTDNILLSLREAMRQGTAAFTNDLRLLSQDWHTDLSSISQKISIWHGTLDQHVPIDLVRELQGLLSNSELYEVEDQGHLLIYYRWQEILEHAKQRTYSK